MIPDFVGHAFLVHNGRSFERIFITHPLMNDGKCVIMNDVDTSNIDPTISIVQQGLVRTGVRTVQLGTEEAIELLYKMFNPGEEGKPMPLNAQ